MKHAEIFAGDHARDNRAHQKATGRFYTHLKVAQRLAGQVTQLIDAKIGRKVRVIDPFCGDGRLVVALINTATGRLRSGRTTWQIALWDIDSNAVEVAREAVADAAKRAGIRVNIESRVVDSFRESARSVGLYDCVVTNPPWDALKPDRRDQSHLTDDARKRYIAELRAYDEWLGSAFPHSQPKNKFSGWGTNLSRCGMEAALSLVADAGVCAIVMPASVLTDHTSVGLREWALNEFAWLHIDYYPAEARLFDGVDQPSTTLVVRRGGEQTLRPNLTRFSTATDVASEERLSITLAELRAAEYMIPLHVSRSARESLARLRTFPTLGDLRDDLWLGRELDETNRTSFLGSAGTPFLKGRVVARYAREITTSEFVRDGARTIPESVAHPRVTWRDVSRPNQARRVQATIIPAGLVTGNSLHVAYFRDDNPIRLLALLGVVNSIIFEVQVRASLGTGHISVGVVRAGRVPNILDDKIARPIAEAAEQQLGCPCDEHEASVDALVASAYGFTRADVESILSVFPKLAPSYAAAVLRICSSKVPRETPRRCDQKQVLENAPSSDHVKIPNHITAPLSELDMQVAHAVPPGGNWKNIPTSVPSKRLEQIRESFAAGEGSRSTYYGRLRPDAPAYTINTYFDRPGNGCHLHYDADQHRVISQREAARLQSFPDHFVFMGPKGSINKQIGNAVPPLLAYQIALRFPEVGSYIDLFAGAGGLSLGFSWAGWRTIVAADVEPWFLATYARNIHDRTICGDLRNAAIQREVKSAVDRTNNGPLLVVGGPPCQGFSTAGHRRSMSDSRNTLFYAYRDVLQTVQPDAFVFENVTGLGNMEAGRILALVKQELGAVGFDVRCWKLSAEQFGVPQRRTRYSSSEHDTTRLGYRHHASITANSVLEGTGYALGSKQGRNGRGSAQRLAVPLRRARRFETRLRFGTENRLSIVHARRD